MYGKTPETLNFQGFLHLSWSQLTLAELRSAAGGFETVLARLFCQKPLNFTWLSSFGISTGAASLGVFTLIVALIASGALARSIRIDYESGSKRLRKFLVVTGLEN